MDPEAYLADLRAKGIDASIGPQSRLPLPPVKPAVMLVLPFPPSVNHYWRHTMVNGRPVVLLSKVGRAYRKTVDSLVPLMGQMAGSLSFTAVFCPPDNRRRDLDNLLKAIIDALQHAGVYRDDSQIREINIRFGDVVKHGAAKVVIKVLE